MPRIGKPYSQIRPSRVRPDATKVLFVPTETLSVGSIIRVSAEENAKTMKCSKAKADAVANLKGRLFVNHLAIDSAKVGYPKGVAVDWAYVAIDVSGFTTPPTAVDDPVYLTDAGALDSDPGTIPKIVGRVISDPGAGGYDATACLVLLDPNAEAQGELDGRATALLTKRGTITSAQLLAINSTPVTLIAAPGATKWIEVESVLYHYDYGTSAYTISLAPNLITEYSGGQDVAEPVPNAGFVDQATDQFRFTRNDGTAFAYPQTVVANQAVQVTSGADLAAGDGVVHYEILYRVRDGSLA